MHSRSNETFSSEDNFSAETFPIDTFLLTSYFSVFILKQHNMLPTYVTNQLYCVSHVTQNNAMENGNRILG